MTSINIYIYIYIMLWRVLKAGIFNCFSQILVINSYVPISVILIVFVMLYILTKIIKFKLINTKYSFLSQIMVLHEKHFSFSFLFLIISLSTTVANMLVAGFNHKIYIAPSPVKPSSHQYSSSLSSIPFSSQAIYLYHSVSLPW